MLRLIAEARTDNERDALCALTGHACVPVALTSLLDERAQMVEALRGLAGYFRSGNAVPVEKATIRTDSTEVKALFAALARAEGGE